MSFKDSSKSLLFWSDQVSQFWEFNVVILEKLRGKTGVLQRIIWCFFF